VFEDEDDSAIYAEREFREANIPDLAKRAQKHQPLFQ